MALAKPKQKRSLETLDKIIAACDALLAESTFEEISMQAIAHRAGISVGNLYNRFVSKEALIVHLIERMNTRYIDSVLENLKSNPTDMDLASRLDCLATAVETSLLKNAPLIQAVAARNLARQSPQTEATDQQGQQIVETLTRWLFQAGGEIRHAAPKAACQFAVTSIIFGLQYRLIFDTPDRLYGTEPYKRQLVEMARSFLTNPKK